MKGIFWKEGEAFSNSMSLIAFLLVRYPEIGTVRFDPEQQTMQFSFVLTKPLADVEVESFKQALLMSLDSLVQLSQKSTGKVEVRSTVEGNLTFLEVVREIASLTQEEIALIIGLVRRNFEGCLQTETEDAAQEEEVVLQEEMIEHMLDNLKDTRQGKRLIGFREEGRVMVFNRAEVSK